MKINTKQKKTLGEIFAEPTSSKVRWKDVESLFNNMGARIVQGNGSRISIYLEGERRTFHKPHPGNEIKKCVIRDIRDFLKKTGVNHDEKL